MRVRRFVYNVEKASFWCFGGHTCTGTRKAEGSLIYKGSSSFWKNKARAVLGSTFLEPMKDRAAPRASEHVQLRGSPPTDRYTQPVLCAQERTPSVAGGTGNAARLPEQAQQETSKHLGGTQAHAHILRIPIAGKRGKISAEANTWPLASVSSELTQASQPDSGLGGVFQ